MQYALAKDDITSIQNRGHNPTVPRRTQTRESSAVQTGGIDEQPRRSSNTASRAILLNALSLSRRLQYRTV